MRPSTPLPSASSCRRLHAGEEGMLSLTSLFVVMIFLVLIGVLVNVDLVAARKIETQNAADSTAYAAALEMTRGMNSVTAINHLIGELTAVVIMIHTLGGDELDQGKQPSTPKTLQYELKLAYEAAKLASKLKNDVTIYTDAYDEAKKDSKVGGAIYDARMRLKKVLTWALIVHAEGDVAEFALEKIPVYGEFLKYIGYAIALAAKGFEIKVYEECKILDALETVDTDILNPLKKVIRDAFIPIFYVYEQIIVWTTPFQAASAAGDMGKPNLADSSLYPSFASWPILQLPVQAEPGQLNNQDKSQLMRATTPWVQWWRLSWMEFGRDTLRLSRFACAVQDRSTKYTSSIVKSLKQDKSINLYILKDLDLDGSGKTHEKWVTDSSEADKLFTVVGLAHRRAPAVAGSGVYHQENPDGMVCYAQALFYNANPEQRGSGNKTWQPIAGWDTLNWNDQVPEYPGPGSPDDACGSPHVSQPRIQLNWRAKLVPTTRLLEASPFQTGPSGRILLRTLPCNDLPLARTH